MGEEEEKLTFPYGKMTKSGKDMGVYTNSKPVEQRLATISSQRCLFSHPHPQITRKPLRTSNLMRSYEDLFENAHLLQDWGTGVGG